LPGITNPFSRGPRAKRNWRSFVRQLLQSLAGGKPLFGRTSSGGTPFLPQAYSISNPTAGTIHSKDVLLNNSRIEKHGGRWTRRIRVVKQETTGRFFEKMFTVKPRTSSAYEIHGPDGPSSDSRYPPPGRDGRDIRCVLFTKQGRMLFPAFQKSVFHTDLGWAVSAISIRNFRDKPTGTFFRFFAVIAREAERKQARSWCFRPQGHEAS